MFGKYVVSDTLLYLPAGDRNKPPQPLPIGALTGAFTCLALPLPSPPLPTVGGVGVGGVGGVGVGGVAP